MKQVAQTTHLCSLPRQFVNLPAEPMRRHPVVVVPVRDQVAATEFTSEIAFCSQRQFAFEALVTNSFVSGNQIGDAVLPVVEDDQFLVWIVLS